MAARKKKPGKPTLARARRARAVRPSAAIQAGYRRRLQASNQQYKKQVDKAVKRTLEEIESLDRSKPGAFQKEVTRIQKRIAGLERNLAAADKRSVKAVDRFIRETEKDNLKRTKAAFKVTPKQEAELEAKQKVVQRTLKRLRANYVESITSANRDYSDRIQRALYDKLANPGVNARKKIRRARGIVSRRIKNTVYDQAHYVNAQLNQTRQRALGSSKYMWQSMEDDVVRPTHTENNRLVFSWSARPQLTGHPGEDHGCRCIAIPVFDDITVGTKL